ncbi:hypothetical protein [Sphingobium sp. Sx8-8]|uniref:hypothetical protein n=1 Tax=Sphingobium sp. Sx8-8 TaxID=2933617 RepID=UPI001F5799C2|nr:hypothetical protein [Sphingobium sp. Sx8-8]
MFMDLSPTRSIGEAKPAVLAPVFSYLERMAIKIGIKDGEIVRNRSRLSNVLIFFARPTPVSLANPRLEALRAYAELARALFPRSVPTMSLEEAGFSASQRRELSDMIGRQAQISKS